MKKEIKIVGIKTLMMIDLHRKPPMFLQIGFVAAFLFVCMVSQPVNAQKIKRNKTMQEKAVLEEDPEFPGGDSARVQFLTDNIVYPIVAREKGLQGRVIVSFVVEPDGSITNIKVAKSSKFSILDEEALRVVNLMPKWKPGKIHGRAARVQFQMPITFSLY